MNLTTLKTWTTPRRFMGSPAYQVSICYHELGNNYLVELRQGGIFWKESSGIQTANEASLKALDFLRLIPVDEPMIQEPAI